MPNLADSIGYHKYTPTKVVSKNGVTTHPPASRPRAISTYRVPYRIRALRNSKGEIPSVLAPHLRPPGVPKLESPGVD